MLLGEWAWSQQEQRSSVGVGWIGGGESPGQKIPALGGSLGRGALLGRNVPKGWVPLGSLLGQGLLTSVAGTQNSLCPSKSPRMETQNQHKRNSHEITRVPLLPEIPRMGQKFPSNLTRSPSAEWNQKAPKWDRTVSLMG